MSGNKGLIAAATLLVSGLAVFALARRRKSNRDLIEKLHMERKILDYGVYLFWDAIAVELDDGTYGIITEQYKQVLKNLVADDLTAGLITPAGQTALNKWIDGFPT